jgi:hypothetical protein
LKFPALDFLYIEFEADSKLQNFPPFFHCAPQLSSLQLDFKKEVKDLEILIPPGATMETLTELIVLDRKSAFLDFIPKLPRTFPQLFHLSLLEMSEDFSSFGAQIWTHLTQLESMELGIHQEESLHALDSVLTGMPLESCERLYKESPENLQAFLIPHVASFLRRKSSIMDLQSEFFLNPLPFSHLCTGFKSGLGFESARMIQGEKVSGFWN